MAERFAADLFFIVLALLIAAILGFIIGWLMRGSRISELENEVHRLEKELAECNKRKMSMSSAPKEGSGAGVSPFDGAAAKLAFGKTIKQDDLTVVEGIGPKIAGLLQNDGISTWSSLSKVEVSRIQRVLDVAGDRYKMHNPSTWPKQAMLAANGNWSELKNYQDKLDGGKEVS